MFGADQVLTAKLLPPRPRRHTLVRPRLQGRLMEALEVPLTIVHAGPGYGKTTALASFLAEQPHPVVWYGIAEGDADPLPFLLHLIYALRMANPHIGEKALSVLAEGEGPNRPWHLAVEALINDMVFSRQPETLVVLDDFHLVDEVPPVRSVVEHLVDHLPPHAHLIIASRRRPPLAGLPKWRARAEVLEVGESDLVFTPEEVGTLFRAQYGLHLTDQQCGELARHTEGWIIALQLVWQGMRKGSALAEVWGGRTGSLEALFAYLAQEVLARQKGFVRRFLLTTAVLERLTAAACDAVMGESGSERVLAELEENGLFLQPLPGGGYRYHQLFQQFLRERAQEDEETWRAHQRRAAHHYQEAGDQEEAAVHLLEAGDYQEAARTVTLAAPALLEGGRTDQLLSLLDRLPPPTFEAYPELRLRWGDGLRLTSRFEGALDAYREAAERYREAGDRRGLCLALQAQGRVYLDTIQPGEADGLLREALSLSEALTEQERATLLALIAENETNRGRPEDAARFAQMAAAQVPLREDLEVRAHLRTGRLAAAVACLDRLERQGRSQAVRSHREVPLLYSLLASLMGDAERALATAEDGIAAGQEKGSPFVEAVGHMRRGHALQLNPLTPFDEAAAGYRQAIEMMDELRVVRGKAEPLAGLTLLYGHAAGDWAQAEKHGRVGAQIAAAARDQWFYAFCLLALGSAGLATGHDDEGRRYLGEAEQAFQEAGDANGLALARLWQAVLAHREGEWERFGRAMSGALTGAQQGGYAFLFTRRTLFGLRDQQALIPLLSEARARSIQADYAGWLLAEMGIANPDHHPGFTLRIRILGNFAVWRGRQEVTVKDWQREKAKQLFQLFITQRRRLLQKEQIIDLLWPGAESSAAFRDFKVALNALFNALEPNRAARSGSFYIVRQGTAYGLNLASGFWLDADEFEGLATQGLALVGRGKPEEAERPLRRALDLYQGDFLEDAPYEDWAAEERERLRLLYLRAAETLAQRALHQGDYESCIQLCDRILIRDHCWEEAFRLLMQSYNRMGNRSMALRTYDRCVQNLEAELSIKPMAETQQLYERIRSSGE
ncbi:MAG: BTAD domain-containing putative transcriptional regulator [Bacillota bacterium]